MTKSSRRFLLAATLALAVRPAAALTGREVIDDAQRKNGFATWHDRVLDTTMESYTTTLQRTRDATVSEQTDPRGEHRTFMEFTGPADVTGTLFLHLSPRGDKDQQWVWVPSTRKARRLADAPRRVRGAPTRAGGRMSEPRTESPVAIDVSGLPLVGVIVKLEDEPVATYRGGIAGLAATSRIATGAARLDRTSGAVAAYRQHLAQRFASFEGSGGPFASSSNPPAWSWLRMDRRFGSVRTAGAGGPR